MMVNATARVTAAVGARCMSSTVTGGLRVGMVLEKRKVFSAEEVKMFAGLVGDPNPLHLDAEYAAKTQFGRPIAHGMLFGSLFSGILGSLGNGTVYLKQSLKFVAPSFVGDPIDARCTVKDIFVKAGKDPRVAFQTECFNANGDMLLTGEALVLVPAQFVHHSDAQQ